MKDLFADVPQEKMAELIGLWVTVTIGTIIAIVALIWVGIQHGQNNKTQTVATEGPIGPIGPAGVQGNTGPTGANGNIEEWTNVQLIHDPLLMTPNGIQFKQSGDFMLSGMGEFTYLGANIPLNTRNDAEVLGNLVGLATYETSSLRPGFVAINITKAGTGQLTISKTAHNLNLEAYTGTSAWATGDIIVLLGMSATVLQN